ncbi:SixA phosphatase family protein [Georgenia deserti]|uniref:SixA phosphatase family protein n=1 Tax=Georgenia deserti TaxID=2093781 RepID=A0ABW4L4P0_9MICO
MSTRTLILLRHAKAEPEGDHGDADRPLAARGRRQCGLIGPQLAGAVGAVDLVLVSSALRTTQTYELIAPDLEVRAHETRAEIYDAGPRDLLSLLREVDPEAGTVLVVGHEPTMSGTASLLHDARDDLAKQVSLGISTASACVLDVPGAWAELDRSTAHLRQILRPGE